MPTHVYVSIHICANANIYIQISRRQMDRCTGGCSICRLHEETRVMNDKLHSIKLKCHAEHSSRFRLETTDNR